MTQLSVNLNKIALIRNSRGEGEPNILDFVTRILRSSSGGITLHPRTDERHVLSSDVVAIKKLIKSYPNKELNLEGNPFSKKTKSYPGFLPLVEKVIPHQVTLVPDAPEQLTSYYGWDLKKNYQALKKPLSRLLDKKIRVSLFMDVNARNIYLAKELGVERVEIHTGKYARAFSKNNYKTILKKYKKMVMDFNRLGIEVNAGHDLNLNNLANLLKEIPSIKEVSIGHAFICESLNLGFDQVLEKYLKIIQSSC